MRNKGARRGRPVFYVGQPVDHVLEVARRTGRRWVKPSHILNEEAVQREDGSLNPIAVAERGIVQYYYPDATLTFKRGRDPRGKGALCFRVTEIEQGEQGS